MTTQTDLLNGLVGSAAIKLPVRIYSPTTLTLSGLQTIQSVSLVEGDRVALFNGTVNSGIYIVSSGVWSRARDFDGKFDVVRGSFFHVLEGTYTNYQIEILTNDTIIVGETVITAYARPPVGGISIVSLENYLNSNGDGVTDNTSAFQNAIDANQYVFVPEPEVAYIITDTIVVPDGHGFVGIGGRGYDYEQASKILFKGTGAKDYSIASITGENTANPSVGEPYLADSGTRGDVYKLTDYSVPFSVGFILGKGSFLENLAILPYFDVLDGYLGSDGAMADDWDVGVWCRNSDNWRMSNVWVFGQWRKAGQLVTSSNLGDGKVPSNELGSAFNCHFQGHKSISIRSSNANTGTNYGFAGTSYINCRAKGFGHQSLHLCTSNFLDTPLSSPSAALEISGYTMRGLKFINTVFNTREDVCIHFGDVNEIYFTDCYLESKNIKISGVEASPVLEGSRIIANSNTVTVKFNHNTKYAVDFAGFQKRETAVSRYVSGTGVCLPNTMYDEDYSQRILGSYTGLRARSSTDAFIFSDVDDDPNVTITGAGRIRYQENLFSEVDTLNLYRRVAGVDEFALRVFSTGNVSVGGVLAPLTDNNRTLGGASFRWSEVFAGNGTINTSDEREKEQIRDLTLAEKNVAIKLKALIKSFKFKDSVLQKGDNARIHVGVIAQEVEQAFLSEGLNGFDYSILCYDEWNYSPASYNEDGIEVLPERFAGNRYGIRYDELLAFIIASL